MDEQPYLNDAICTWDVYQQYRPYYPQKLYDVLFEYHSQGGAKWDMAVDFGSGDCAVPPFLLQRFKNVQATDISEHQLAIGRDRLYKQEGIDKERFTVLACHAGQWPGPDNSVDMITSATSIHWFDQDAFFKDAARMLRKGGTLAFWFAHMQPCILDNDKVQELITTFFREHLYPYFERSYGSGVDKAKDMNASKLAAVGAPPELFESEVRVHFDYPKGYGAVNPWKTKEWVDKTAKDAKIIHDVPETFDKAYILRKGWTSSDLGGLLDTGGRKAEDKLNWSETEEWKACKKQIDDALGGPDMTFDCCWDAHLAMCRKK